MRNDNNLQNFGLGLLGLAFIGLIAWGLFYEIGKAPWQFITIFIGLIGTFIAFAGNLNIQIRNEQKPKKIEIYDKIIKLFFDSLFAEKLGMKPKDQDELSILFAEMIPDLILWASDDVLNIFIKFKSDNSSNKLFLFGEMLLAMRKDLGHQNNKLTKESILLTFINVETNN